MSHFTVLVIGENPEKQLQPFYEGLEVPRYQKYSKEELIKKGREEIESYKNGLYAEYLKNPQEYLSNCNQGHANYISKEFPEKLKWSDEQIYIDQIRYYEPSEIGRDGEVYSTYNPNSKWDWFLLGGRWSGLIKLKDGKTGITGKSGVFDNEVGIDSAKKGDILNLSEITTFAVLKDGKWYERGSMGWWGVVCDEIDGIEWENRVRELLANLDDETLISVYDCHI